MKKLLIVYILLLMKSAIAASSTEDVKGIYARVDSGASFPLKSSSTSFEATPIYNIGVGYHFNDLFRSDLNLQYRRIKAKNSLTIEKIDNYDIMLNGYLNLTDSKDSVIPYLMAGIGYSKNKLGSFSNSYSRGAITANTTQQGSSANSTIWNVGVGGMVHLVKNIDLDLSYRYINLGNVRGQTTISATGENPSITPLKINSLKANEVTAGLILKF